MKFLKIIAALMIAASLFGCVDTPESLKKAQTEPAESGEIILGGQNVEESPASVNTSEKPERSRSAAAWKLSEISLKPT